MSIFSRIFKVGEAGVNKVIDKLEDPEIMLEQAIRDKEKQIKESKKAVQGCVATEKQTKALLDKEIESKKTWELKAEQALKAGKEELALKAVERSTEHEKKSATLEANWKRQKTDVDKLKEQINKLEDELAEYKRNKDFIIAQSKAAEAKKDIYEAKAKISKKYDTENLMERMKAKAERVSYEADAAEEMSEEGGDSLEKEFESLGATTASSEAQDKLAALKSKLGQS